MAIQYDPDKKYTSEELEHLRNANPPEYDPKSLEWREYWWNLRQRNFLMQSPEERVEDNSINNEMRGFFEATPSEQAFTTNENTVNAFDRVEDSTWTAFRDMAEGMGVVAGNYFLPGSSLLTGKLVSEGAQEHLSGGPMQMANIASGLMGAGVGSEATGQLSAADQGYGWGNLGSQWGQAPGEQLAAMATPGADMLDSGVTDMRGTIPGMAEGGAGTALAGISTSPSAALSSGVTDMRGTIPGMIGSESATALAGVGGAGALTPAASPGAVTGAGTNIITDPTFAASNAARATEAAGGVGRAASIIGGLAGGAEAASSWTDWINPALNIGSGLYGLYEANEMRELAEDAIPGAAPWAASGGVDLAGDELKRVISGDFEDDPGFAMAQRAAAATSSTQPGGFAAHAASQAALQYQNQRIAALSGPAGVGFNPGAGYQTAGAIYGGASTLASQSLGSIGYGANQIWGGNPSSMPPWLQSYLIQNGLGA